MKSRLPLHDASQMTPEQRAIHDSIVSTRGNLEGPFLAWLHSPGLAAPAEQLGAFCRYGTSLSLQEYPHMAGSASAMLGLLTFIGGAAIAPLVGVAGDHSAGPLSVIILGCSLIGALGCLFVTRRGAHAVAPGL